MPIVSMPAPALRAAQTAPASAVDPKAKAALDSMAAAHRKLSSYSATVTVSGRADGRSEDATGKVAFSRPGKVRVSVSRGADSVLSVSDGAFHLLRTGRTDRKVKAEPGDKGIASGMIDANLFIAPVFYWSVTESDAAKKLLPGSVTRLGFGPIDETLDGVGCETVIAQVENPNGATRLEFAIGREDHLLRRLVIRTSRGIEFSETYTSVRANPDLPAETFAIPAPQPAAPKPVVPKPAPKPTPKPKN